MIHPSTDTPASGPAPGHASHHASHHAADPAADEAARRFWSEFDGAYRALLASVRQRAGEAGDAPARGAMKIRTRDAVVLVTGIAALLDVVRRERR